MTGIDVGPVFEVPIDRSKVEEFARATKSSNSAFRGADAVSPPTFLTVATLVWEPEEANVFASVGFDMARVLHGAEEFVFHGPPPSAGTTLWAQSHIHSQYEKQGKRGGTMRFLELVTEFRDADSTLVVEKRSTLIETAPAEERS